MTRTTAVAWVVCLATVFGVTPLAMAQDAPNLTGDTGIHDPTWIEVDGVQVAFGTGVERAADGGAIRVKTSPDGLVWTDAGTIGQGVPDWVEPTIGTVPPNIWAPHAFVRGERVYLYYSVSTFGVNVSAIGLMTNDVLDPAKPTEGWIDRGVVLQSTRADTFNAIDAARIDTPDGKAWLSFGSWWDGIKMREIDPGSGKLIEGNTILYSLASRGGGAIEAPSILEHGGKYYLFVSFDRCCIGIASTYNIRVGRADTATGPYFDKDGVPMLASGGTIVLEASGDFRGPGWQEAFATPGGDILVFHYYSLKAGGAPKLQILPIRWTEDGWPEVGPLP